MKWEKIKNKSFEQKSYVNERDGNSETFVFLIPLWNPKTSFNILFASVLQQYLFAGRTWKWAAHIAAYSSRLSLLFKGRIHSYNRILVAQRLSRCGRQTNKYVKQLICWFLVKCRELFKGNEDHELSSKISCKNKAPNNENVII
ncbi:hypothetical protein WUBG_02344 [Wuchereria bancrofti]|uniref:Uncharacterized protein n=1 Tax=Wuchereria bancrofti TaxID=6293 RepID=J9BHE1_WUCBA|nr:hypothetical protein WUBG_02344 [Wuchereria bancrofti]